LRQLRARIWWDRAAEGGGEGIGSGSAAAVPGARGESQAEPTGGGLMARDLPGDSRGAVKLVKVGCTPLQRTLGPRGLCVGFLFFLFLFLPSPKSKSCDYEICDAPSTLPASYNKEW